MLFWFFLCSLWCFLKIFYQMWKGTGRNIDFWICFCFWFIFMEQKMQDNTRKWTCTRPPAPARTPCYTSGWGSRRPFPGVLGFWAQWFGLVCFGCKAFLFTSDLVPSCSHLILFLDNQLAWVVVANGTDLLHWLAQASHYGTWWVSTLSEWLCFLLDAHPDCNSCDGVAHLLALARWWCFCLQRWFVYMGVRHCLLRQWCF